MPADWHFEPLRQDHHRARFDCGESALDSYLARFARQHSDSGVSRTFVAVSDGVSAKEIMGFYSLAAGAIDCASLPPIGRSFPNFPLPIARLARLAVDRAHQGKGLGGALLYDALSRCLRIAGDIGLTGLVIDAKHEQAKAFYARYEFVALPDQPLTLWLPMPAIRKLFAQSTR